MLSCPECGGNLQFIGSRKPSPRQHIETFRCIGCRATYEVDEPTELSEVDRAIIQEALHSERIVELDDSEPWQPPLFPPPKSYPY